MNATVASPRRYSSVVSAAVMSPTAASNDRVGTTEPERPAMFIFCGGGIAFIDLDASSSKVSKGTRARTVWQTGLTATGWCRADAGTALSSTQDRNVLRLRAPKTCIVDRIKNVIECRR